MNTEHRDIPDVLDVARFGHRHPALDQALRQQIKAPVMDATFRKQVMARIATQRAEQATVVAPRAVRTRLRAQLLLQLANIGAAALTVALMIRVAWPWLASLPVTSWVKQGGLPLAVTIGGAALLYGLHRARLLGWVRSLDA